MTPALLLALALSAQAPDTNAEVLRLADLARADEVCTLFDPVHRALLHASIARAEDDAVRAGADPARIAAEIAALTEIDPPACDAPILAAIASAHDARVAELLALNEIIFPGAARRWTVDRAPIRPLYARQPNWRVLQTANGAASFGVFEQENERHFALAYRGETQAARANLVFRDPRHQAHPIDFSAGGLLEAPDGDPAAAWGADRRGQAQVSASARLDGDTAASLAPAGGQPARGFIFPESALERLTILTPREGVAVEFYNAFGEVTDRVWFEVGALHAALALDAVPWIEPAESDASEPIGETQR